MVFSVLAFALSAQATVAVGSGASCTLSAKPFLVGCGGMATLGGGKTCKLMCQKFYVPTVTTITCPAAGGSVTPSTYMCVPQQQALYPWRSGLCTSVAASGGFSGYMVGSAYGTVSGTAVAPTSAASDEVQLTGTGATDTGVFSFGPMRTRGGRTAIELQFQVKAVSGGGDGFFGFISTAAPVAPSYASSLGLDPSTVFAVEIDLVTDASAGDMTAPYMAVLTAPTQTHSTTTGLTNLMASLPSSGAGAVTSGTYHAVNVLIQPIQGSNNMLVTGWYNGMTVVRDTILAANVPTGLGSLVRARTSVWVGVMSSTRSGSGTPGMRYAKGVTLCGVERPHFWSRLYVMNKVRMCQQVQSFGNPDPRHSGVWKPFACPTRGATIVPLAPSPST